jgi:hypothetical protein
MRITLKRTTGNWWNERRYKIFIQGQQVATLKEGKSQVIDIETNPITVEAKFDWFGSGRHTILVNDGDTIEFIDNTMLSKQAPFVGVPSPILVILYRGIDTLWLKLMFAALTAGILFWVVYILFISRKRWIFIKPIKHI